MRRGRGDCLLLLIVLHLLVLVSLPRDCVRCPELLGPKVVERGEALEGEGTSQRENNPVGTADRRTSSSFAFALRISLRSAVSFCPSLLKLARIEAREGVNRPALAEAGLTADWATLSGEETAAAWVVGTGD